MYNLIGPSFTGIQKTGLQFDVAGLSIHSELYLIEIRDNLNNIVEYANVEITIDGVTMTLSSFDGIFLSPFHVIDSLLLTNTISGGQLLFTNITLLSDEINIFRLAQSLTGVSANLAISQGRVFLDGVPYFTGTAAVLDTSTGQSYTVPVVDGCFPIYHSVTNLGTPNTLLVSVRDTDFRGSKFVELTEPRLVFITLEEAVSMAGKLYGVEGLPSISLEPDFEFDIGDKCCETELVFAAPNGETWQNDKSSFLLRKLLKSDNHATFKLMKGCNEISFVGDVFEFPNYTGIQIDWENVYLQHGAGTYYYEAIVPTAGVLRVWKSRLFELAPYDPVRADRTIRIEAWQRGTITRGLVNYDETGEWYQSIRLGGFFGDMNPVMEVDYLTTVNRQNKLIQSQIRYEYDLRTMPVTRDFRQIVINDMFLANRIRISDYNVFNSDNLKEIEVAPESVEETSHFTKSRKVAYVFKFKDRTEDIIKRT